jgi:putative ABC transport system substrate-binding protein
MVLIGAGAALVSASFRLRAAAPQRDLVILYPHGTTHEIRNAPLIRGFLSELGRLNYVEAETVKVSIRSAGGDIDAYPKIAKAAVDDNPDLIFSYTASLARQVRATTTTIPLVVCLNDPEASGLAGAMDGLPQNVTGVDLNGDAGLYAARLNVLRQAGLKFIKPAFMTPNIFDLRNRVNELRTTWKGLVPILIESPINEATLRLACKVMIDEGADALMVSNSLLLATFSDLVAGLAREHRLPAVYPYRSYVEAGGLLSYGMNFEVVGRLAAVQAAQIFDGAAPKDIKFHRSTDYELAVNQKAARALNVTLNEGLVGRAAVVLQ